ncbi:hypothetical protein ACE1CI_18335 [Aerosakkonemataceae cyanobacterium BLCC-F50]|uniref:Uncharacterized protein n=1 Tax=Floridaenema flaviceps BLCC-F50 TaxID=3153642 RepID=A0ABV4XT22_9CYAN
MLIIVGVLAKREFCITNYISLVLQSDRFHFRSTDILSQWSNSSLVKLRCDGR